MNKAGTFWLAVVNIMVFGARLAFCLPVGTEPEYQGRPLEAWLRDMRSRATRDDAVIAICNMKPSPAPFLVERMRSSDFQEQGVAIQGLMALGPAARSVLPDLARMISCPDLKLGELAIRVLSQIGPESAPAMIDALKNLPPPKSSASRRDRMAIEMKREELVFAIGTMGPNAQPAIPILLHDLKDEDFHVRNGAVLALSRIGPENREVISNLLKCLRDSDETTRRNAADGLAGLDLKEYAASRREFMKLDFDPLANASNLPPADPAVLDGLRQMAERDPVHADREAATFSLIKLDPKGTLAEFINNLESDDTELRRNSAWNLGYFKKGARTAVPLLIKCISDKDAKVRQNSAVALREIGEQPDAVVPALIKSLSDPDQHTRDVAAVALGAFGARAKPAVPQIIQMLKHAPDELDASGLYNALYKIDPQTAARLQQESDKGRRPIENR